MPDLVAHPDHSPRAVRSVTVHVGTIGHGYRFYFFVAGDIRRVVVPDRSAKPGRVDGLWQKTVFEAFVSGVDPGRAATYCEFNFSPSCDWAAYSFDHYREGMRDLPAVIDVGVARLDNLLAVEAKLHADFLRKSRLGLSAIIEETDGRKSYWALAHPAGKPDFHDDACFTLPLADIANP